MGGVNLWKVFGQSTIAFVLVYVLAYSSVTFLEIVPGMEYTMFSSVWMIVAFVFAVVTTKKVGKWKEIVGPMIILFIAPQIPFVTVLGGGFYYAWCFMKMEKHRVNNNNKISQM